MSGQQPAIADIEIDADKAYIGFDSPNASQIEIVQIGDPTNPTSAGVVHGVGGRRWSTASSTEPPTATRRRVWSEA